MKKIIRLFLLTAVIAILVSCKDKSCYYIEQEYNSKTKQCECVQPFWSADIPALKQNDYNTCLAVFRNFYYLSIDNKNYPYYSYAGDTIMCCGYVNGIYYAENGAWLQFSMSDDSLGQYGIIWVESESSKTHNIDLTKKCFIKGNLHFGHNTSHFMWLGAPEPGSCQSPEILLNLTDIKN